VFRVLSAILSWWSTRDDTFVSPVVKGMNPDPLTTRDRVLDDAELRALWAVCERSGTGGRFLMFSLLCAQRRDKIATMRWSDIEGDVWTIRTGAREKSNAGAVRLPPLAMRVLSAQPHIVGQPIFGLPHARTLKRIRAESGVSFRVHDLRRTARTLLSRAKVPTEVSELVLGHSIKGVRKVYDRFEYVEQKSHALAQLAQLIETILTPSADNVVALREAVS
jgi:integrase